MTFMKNKLRKITNSNNNAYASKHIFFPTPQIHDVDSRLIQQSKVITQYRPTICVLDRTDIVSNLR